MGDYWKDNGLIKPQAIVVCAACKSDNIIICGARHWDGIMHTQLDLMQSNGVSVRGKDFEQGFINQFGEFLTREEAFKVVIESGQPFDIDRNGSNDELYSEGLY